jgi:hypothetical protein
MPPAFSIQLEFSIDHLADFPIQMSSNATTTDTAKPTTTAHRKNSIFLRRKFLPPIPGNK